MQWNRKRAKFKSRFIGAGALMVVGRVGYLILDATANTEWLISKLTYIKSLIMSLSWDIFLYLGVVLVVYGFFKEEVNSYIQHHFKRKAYVDVQQDLPEIRVGQYQWDSETSWDSGNYSIKHLLRIPVELRDTSPLGLLPDRLTLWIGKNEISQARRSPLELTAFNAMKILTFEIPEQYRTGFWDCVIKGQTFENREIESDTWTIHDFLGSG